MLKDVSTKPHVSEVAHHVAALLNALIERKDLIMQEITVLTSQLEYLGKEYDAHIALIKRITEFKERGEKV